MKGQDHAKAKGRSGGSLEFFKLNLITILLFAVSALSGLFIALPGKIALYFYLHGALILLIIVTLLFTGVSLYWLILKKKKRIRDPELQVRRQGVSFAAWFAAHNLFWAFALIICTWLLHTLFGPRGWVMIFSAGAWACVLFAISGSLISRSHKMLGLCWRSPVPNGLKNFWQRAGATMILYRRYESAVSLDQTQTAPLLWSISRVYDRKSSGGALRGVELLNPSLPAKKFKNEALHRFKILAILFAVTVLLSSLPGLTGLTAQSWTKAPDGWPQGKYSAAAKKNTKKQHQQDKPFITAKNSSPSQKKQETPVSSSDEKKQSQTGQEGTQNQEGKQAQPGQQGTQNQEGKQAQPGQQGTQDQQGKQAQPGQQGTQNQQGKQAQPGQQGTQNQEGKQAQSGQQGTPNQDGRKSEQGQEGQRGKPEEASSGAAKNALEQAIEQARQDQQAQQEEQGEQGKEESQQSGQQDGQPGGEQEGQQGGQQGGKQDGKQEGKQQGQQGGQQGGQKLDRNGNRLQMGQPGQQLQKPNQQGQNSRGQDNGSSEAPPGSGKGQGSGSPDAKPKTADNAPEEEALPPPPSRAAKMVSLDLPPLSEDRQEEKGESINRKTRNPKTIKKYNAPLNRYKAAKQNRKATSPDQLLPNWIINLIKQKQKKKSKKE